MKTYEVRVYEVVRQFVDVVVEAENEDDAKELAYEKATDGMAEWVFIDSEVEDMRIKEVTND